MHTKKDLSQLIEERDELQLQIKNAVFNGNVEVKTVNHQKYIYVRKREEGRYRSKYIEKYSEEFYVKAVEQAKQTKEMKKQLHKIERDIQKRQERLQ